MIGESSEKINNQSTLVVDVTYLCNYTCNYCRWSDPETPGRFNLPLSEILADENDLKAIGIERVVLSGGEPLLHPEIGRIIEHYSTIVDDVVLITNGWLADISRIEPLVDRGLSGLAFSIDSIDASILMRTRDMSPSQVSRTLSNLENISMNRKKGNLPIEIGVNSVLSSANASVDAIRALLGWSEGLGLDYVNFNVIFDDGFAGKNSPDLLLSSVHADDVMAIVQSLETGPPRILTNTIDFWRIVVETLRGNRLAGSSCGLKDRHAILYRGEFRFCAWLETPSLGSIGLTDVETVTVAREGFLSSASGCKTGHHCHCLQRTDHVWGLKK